MVLLLGVGAWLLGQQLASSSPPRHVANRSPSVPSGVVSFQDAAGAFAVSYPSSWQQLPSTDAQVSLLAASSAGASLQVRKTAIGAPVTAANLGAGKTLADRVVKSGKHVTFLRPPQQVTLGGLPGYLYLYTFDDPATGQRGAHAHYFLFAGTTVITLVFQALPENRMLSLAPLFDRIAGTFRTPAG